MSAAASLQPTPAQTRAIAAPASVFISAGAGSGKTRVLAERIVRLLAAEGGPLPRQIVAVTFTEAAAQELRARVTRFVEERAESGEAHWLGVLTALPLMTIGTIHSLCGRIAREHPVESGAGLSFLIQDETEAGAWLEERLPLALSACEAGDLLALPGRLRAEVTRALLADPLAARAALDAALRQTELPSEERRLLAWRQVEAEWSAALTQLGLFSGPAGEKLEAYRLSAVQLGEPAPCSAAGLCALETALQNYNGHLGGKKWSEEAKAAVHAGLKTLQGLSRRSDLRGETAALAVHDRALASLSRVFDTVNAQLQAWRTQEEVATFADLEVYADRALRRAEVQAYYAQRFTHLLIDEAQDTNPVQWRILKGLAGLGVNLTVVGDEKQSIYAFRRADVRVFHQARTQVQHLGGEQVTMHTSFRTHAPLVEVMNAYFASLMTGPTAAGSTRATFESLEAHRQDNPAGESAVEWHAVLGEADVGTLRSAEGHYLAARIQGLLLSARLVHGLQGLRPVRLSDIAVLFRARGDMKRYEDALSRAGLPFVVHGGRGLLTRPEVLDAVHLLQAVADPTADVSLAAVLRGPVAHLTDAALLRLARSRQPEESLWAAAQRSPEPEVQRAVTLLSGLRDRAATLPASQLLTEAERLTHLSAVHALQPDGPRRLENLRRFSGLLRQWAGEGKSGVTAVAQHLRRLERLGHEEPEAPAPHADAVQLMTIHGSKGLEFPVVIVADVLRGAGGSAPAVRFDAEHGVAISLPQLDRPSAAWDHLAGLEREREDAEAERVAYVAFTRAADLLILSGSAKDAELKRLTKFESHLPADGVMQVQVDLDSVTPAPRLRLDVRTGRPDLTVLQGPGAALPETLPVTALATYRTCPRQFAHRYVNGFVPLADLWAAQAASEASNPERRSAGRTIGDAVHKAIEQGLAAGELAAAFPHLSPADLKDVARYVAAAKSSVFAEMPGPFVRERPIQIQLGGVMFEGVVDAWNEAQGLILDYKTDREVVPEHHLPQLSVYAHRLGSKTAALAYLRQEELHVFSSEDLARGLKDVEGDIERMTARDFTPNPSVSSCRRCPYRGVCDVAEPMPQENA